MLTKEQNELICQVGPGTPGGEWFRRYWIAAGSEALLRTISVLLNGTKQDSYDDVPR